MSTTTDVNTTADYAEVMFGNATPNQKKPSAAEPVDAADDTATKAKRPKHSAKTNPAEPDAAPSGGIRSIGDAAGWMPRDFASVSPAPLIEAVAAHRDRYQGFDNLGAKALYALYASLAVPTGFALNVVSLVAAHVSTAINEPTRAREAALGIVFLTLIIGSLILVWV